MIQQQKVIANIKIKRFWLILRSLSYTFCALKSNFAIRKEEKVKEEVRNFSAWRIAYRFKVYTRRVSTDPDDRLRNHLRRGFALAAQTFRCAEIDRAKDIMHKVLINYAEICEIESKFTKTRMLLFKIQLKIKRFLKLKENRLKELKNLWNFTKDKLINDFMKANRDIK